MANFVEFASRHYKTIITEMSKGKDLARKLRIDCNQALYSEQGNFYAPILKYPCVLFDKAEFLIINSSNELDGFGIKLKKRTNVPKLISIVLANLLAFCFENLHCDYSAFKQALAQQQTLD